MVSGLDGGFGPLVALVVVLSPWVMWGGESVWSGVGVVVDETSGSPAVVLGAGVGSGPPAVVLGVDVTSGPPVVMLWGGVGVGSGLVVRIRVCIPSGVEFPSDVTGGEVSGAIDMFCPFVSSSEPFILDMFLSLDVLRSEMLLETSLMVEVVSIGIVSSAIVSVETSSAAQLFTLVGAAILDLLRSSSESGSFPVWV